MTCWLSVRLAAGGTDLGGIRIPKVLRVHACAVIRRYNNYSTTTCETDGKVLASASPSTVYEGHTARTQTAFGKLGQSPTGSRAQPPAPRPPRALGLHETKSPGNGNEISRDT